MSWHTRNPKFYEQVRREVEAAYPDLRFEQRGSHVWLVGPFVIAGDDGVELTRFELAIRLPHDFPEGVPAVYEANGRIRPFADYHAYRDARACLWAPGERWKHWPRGSSLVDFLKGPLRSHLADRAYFELSGEWLVERPHNEDGVVQAFEEMLGIVGADRVTAFLRLFTRGQPKGHWICPCGSGLRLRDCHGDVVHELAQRLSADEVEQALFIMTRSTRVAA